MAEEPVAQFCADLSELRRTSGRGHTGLATELKMSRTHLYAILNGEVKRPPDFARFVDPFVRACGGGDAEVGEWREKHDATERAYEEQRRRQRQAPAAPEPAAATQPPPYVYAQPRPRWVTVLVAVLGAAAIALVAGTVAAKLAGNDPPAPVAAGASLSPARRLCPRPAPPKGTNLLDALPDQETSGDKHHQLWWASNNRVHFDRTEKYGFDAVVAAGMPTIPDLVIVRSCVPLVAGRPYHLELTVKASRTATLRVRVQDNNTDLYTPSHQVDVKIGPAGRRLTMDFAGAVSSPANELTLQVGGNPEFRFETSDVILVERD